MLAMGRIMTKAQVVAASWLRDSSLSVDGEAPLLAFSASKVVIFCNRAPLRHFLPYQAFHAATDFPEHNNKSRGGRLSRSPMVHGPWIVGS